MSEQPAGIDTSVPHSARIWNYWLGGTTNYPVDRAAGDAWVGTDPGIVELARASRAFLGRAVRHLVEREGVRQFLDVGSGLPTADNTHEVAQRAAPDSRVVYVDQDPLVLAHARTLLAGSDEGATRFVHADLRDTDAVLAEAAQILDLDRPVAVMFFGVLGHFADTDEVRALVRRYVAALPSGSFLVIADGGEQDEATQKAGDEYAATGAVPYHVRTPAEVLTFFPDGLEFVEPGFVPINEWHPDAVGLPAISNYGGVARKP
jgi:O-methyltransferase involved in polyketide biosynthesis